jgi:hypothetical protein
VNEFKAPSEIDKTVELKSYLMVPDYSPDGILKKMKFDVFKNVPEVENNYKGYFR